MAGIKKYFEDNARQWILDGYNDNGYNYPTAFHRVRIVLNFIKTLKKKKLKIVDLGCGGGDLAFRLAECGHEVLGVDQSQEMINICEKKLSKIPKKNQKNVKFIRKEIDKKLNLGEKFDIVTALGFIGYLPNDKFLFDIADNLLKPNGCLLVSCRNRLFNMNSISFRTEREIRAGEAVELVKELRSLYVQVPLKDVSKFIKNLKEISKNLPNKITFNKKSALSPSQKYRPYVSSLGSEVRQSTPEKLKKIALKCGFEHMAYYGVHPHLMDPNLNKMLPPQFFNKISGCLEALEHLPISLAWSSVFVGVFQKKPEEKLYLHGKK